MGRAVLTVGSLLNNAVRARTDTATGAISVTTRSADGACILIAERLRMAFGGDPGSRARERVGANHPNGRAWPQPRWYVIQYDHGRELSVLRSLTEYGFETYLPLVLTMVRSKPSSALSAKQRVPQPTMIPVRRPAFPGYLFVRFDAASDPWGDITRTACVRRMFQRGDTPTPIPHGVIERLIDGQTDRLMLRSVDPLLEVGAQCAVSAGPFTDHQGVCLYSDQARVRLLLNLFGRMTEVDVQRHYVTAAA